MILRTLDFAAQNQEHLILQHACVSIRLTAHREHLILRHACVSIRLTAYLVADPARAQELRHLPKPQGGVSGSGSARMQHNEPRARQRRSESVPIPNDSEEEAASGTGIFSWISI